MRRRPRHSLCNFALTQLRQTLYQPKRHVFRLVTTALSSIFQALRHSPSKAQHPKAQSQAAITLICIVRRWSLPQPQSPSLFAVQIISALARTRSLSLSLSLVCPCARNQFNQRYLALSVHPSSFLPHHHHHRLNEYPIPPASILSNSSPSSFYIQLPLHYQTISHQRRRRPIITMADAQSTVTRATSLSRKSTVASRNASLIKKNTGPHELRPSDILIERFTGK